MAKSSLVSETIMFSVNRKGNGEVVVHHLPYARDSAMLETYIKRGFTFERPEVLSLLINGSSVFRAEVKVETPKPACGLNPDGIGGKPVVVSNPLQCECGFVAKTPYGLSVHQRRHRRDK